jgi:hypothetical protein
MKSMSAEISTNSTVMQTEAVSSGRALLLRAPKVESIFVLMQFDIKDAI